MVREVDATTSGAGDGDKGRGRNDCQEEWGAVNEVDVTTSGAFDGDIGRGRNDCQEEWAGEANVISEAEKASQKNGCLLQNLLVAKFEIFGYGNRIFTLFWARPELLSSTAVILAGLATLRLFRARAAGPHSCAPKPCGACAALT